LDRIYQAIVIQKAHSEGLRVGTGRLLERPTTVFWEPLPSGERLRWLEELRVQMDTMPILCQSLPKQSVLDMVEYALLFAVAHEFIHARQKHFELGQTAIAPESRFPMELEADMMALSIAMKRVKDKQKEAAARTEDEAGQERSLFWGIYFLLALVQIAEATEMIDADRQQKDLSKYPPAALRWRFLSLCLLASYPKRLDVSDIWRVLIRVVAAADAVKWPALLTFGHLHFADLELKPAYVEWAARILKEFDVSASALW
jgi:hypothetical protein